MRAQKPTLYFCACCAAVTGRERALLNVLHSVSIWVTTRYALHTPFFVIYLQLLRIIIEIWIIDTLMSSPVYTVYFHIHYCVHIQHMLRNMFYTCTHTFTISRLNSTSMTTLFSFFFLANCRGQLSSTLVAKKCIFFIFKKMVN